MRIETTTRTLYTFNELSEEGKQKAIENLSDINTDYSWWEHIYDDAKDIGCEITALDLDRGNNCQLALSSNALRTAELILQNHGENCDSYKYAQDFIAAYNVNYANEEYSDIEDYDYEAILEELTETFTQQLSNYYLKMLRDEYEYQTTEEAITATIEVNNYEFTETGKLA